MSEQVYAWQELSSGEIDIESLAGSPEVVETRVLQGMMGWRYRRASDDEIEKKRIVLQQYGRVVRVEIAWADDQQITSDMTEYVHEYERITRQAHAAIGTTADFDCLDKWLESVCRSIEEGNGMTLSHNACRSLAHTLIDARVRALELKEHRLRSLFRTS